MVLILPGVPAPFDAPTVDLSAFRPASEPLGGVRTLLGRLTGSYSAAEILTIRRVYALLEEAGLLGQLDTLSFKLNNAADSLLNWVGPDSATNNGATFGGDGFAFDGVNDWIDPNFDLSGDGNFKANNAFAGAYVTRDGGGASVRVLGTVDEVGELSHLHPRFLTSNTGFRLNSSATTSVPMVRPDIRGLWSLGNLVDAGDDMTYVFYGSSPVASAEVTFTTIPNSLIIGRNATLYSDLSVSGWFAGAYVLGAQRPVLAKAFEIMNATFVSE